MDGLLLERLPGLPERLRIDVGEQRALVMPDATAARRLADLVVGLDDPPANAIVKAAGAVRLVPAEGGLLPHLTVLGNVVHGHTVTHRVTRKAAEEQSRVTAGRCGLEDVLDRYPHEITPGRRRLAGVARALRAHPAVIVLEDAAGLPTWGSLLRFDHNPELWSAALLLITTDAARTTGFRYAE
jgi:ABC-type nitrate/sulfonate/bicarbonate transport system ATPase subunit